MDFRQLFSPAAERNAEPIARALEGVLPTEGVVLEVAGGSGQHAAFLAKRFPSLRWQPTDADPEALESIAAYQESARLENLLPPKTLDATSEAWPVERADAILCVNMIHISPWDATLGLLSGARRLLGSKAPLILYGPYLIQGKPTAPSNIDFDRSLRWRNSSWGVRNLEDVVEAAKREGFELESVTDMPANNFTVVFRAV